MKAGKITITLLMFVCIGYAQEKSKEKLAKKAQNPLANMMSFPFQDNITFGNGPFSRTSNVLNIQPVLPFFEGRLITRTIIPIVSQPVGESESLSGIGDINFTVFYSPASGGLIWGSGPCLTFRRAATFPQTNGDWGPLLLCLKSGPNGCMAL